MVRIIDLSKDKDKGIRTVEATFMIEGELVPLKISEDDRQEAYNSIIKLIESPNLDIIGAANELYELMSPVAKVQREIASSFYLSNNLMFEDGILKFGEFTLENTLANHILSLLDEDNTPKDEKLWKSYVTFLDNLHQNVNEDIRQQLFRWMEYENKAGNGFGITEDGCIVGYKGCGGTILEPMSKFSGTAIVDGVEMTGQIPNRVGSVVSMPRSAVQYNPEIGCSTGLHVGTRDYAVNWAPVLVLVKFNPRDVVSVPYECDSQKIRVCEYTVLKVTDASEEHQRFHYDEDDYEEYECDCENYEDCEDCEHYEECHYEECHCEDYECHDEDYIICDEIEYYESEDAMSIDEAEELLNEHVFVKYDDSEFIGKVVDIYKDGDNSGIIMRNEDGEYKHIKLYRIIDWELIDENENDCDCIMCLLKNKLSNADNSKPSSEPKSKWLIDKEILLSMVGLKANVEYGNNEKCSGIIVIIDDNDKAPGIVIATDTGIHKHITLEAINFMEVNNPKVSSEIEKDAEEVADFINFLTNDVINNDDRNKEENKDIKELFDFLNFIEKTIQDVVEDK